MAVKPRAVLDTNVFVSGLISPKGPPAGVLQALQSRRFTLVTSPPINEEIIEVLNRPYIRNRYSIDDHTLISHTSCGNWLRLWRTPLP